MPDPEDLGRGWSEVLVIQLGSKTPIKPTSEKYGIRGIRGTESRYVFAARLDGVRWLFFTAYRMS